MADRLYYGESFLTSFEATVTDIHQVSQSREQTLWQIALDRTAFYPTSGGQPHDTGVIEAEAPSGAMLQAPVVAVEEDPQGEIWHTTSKPLLAGTAVRGRIDWNRRRDHVQQHSGQHLLSAVFHREAAAPTISFHLGEMVSTIDLAIESVAPEQLERVEEIANEIIAEDRAVTASTVSRAEADSLLSRGTLRKLPERDGPIRLIEIAGLDLNACGGTHVHSTGQIGSLLIRGVERVKQGVRVEFVCGLRAVHAARQDWEILSRASSALSAGFEAIPGSIEKLLVENKAANKEKLRLREDLAGYHATRLLVEVPIENGMRVVCRVLAEEDAAYIKLLASRLTKFAPQTCALLVSKMQDPAQLVLAASLDLEIDCGAMLRELLAPLGGRGGGTPGMAQGQIPGGQLEALFSAFRAKFAGSVSGE